MATAIFNQFYNFIGDLGSKVHDLQASGDTLKLYLTNTLPINTNAIKSEIAEITAENGYPAGGVDIQNDWGQTLGVGTLTGVDFVITAAGGTIGPFRYAVIYNDTPTSPLDPLVCWYDHGSEVTLLDTQTFTVDFSTSILAINFVP